jgi:alkaline phosphatase D
MDRRSFLTNLGLGLGASFSLTFHAQAVQWLSPGSAPINNGALRADSARVFDLSIASADPTPSGVVLWTHIADTAVRDGEALYVQVASDTAFNNLVLEARVGPEDITAQRDYTVKIDLDGKLLAGSVYYYRFIYDSTVSRTGRCRTAPAKGTSLSRLKFGLLTCQDYTNGYYGALAHVARDDTLDFVLHLGDFIYETAGDPRFQSLPFADRTMILPSGGTVSMGLDDYRFIYRTYRSDPNLQAAMERHTWIMVPDDHETSNDCYWDYARDTLGAPDHPFTTDAQYGNSPALLRQLKLESQRAWVEYVPARVVVNESATHPHDYLRVYRNQSFGSFLDLYLIENRTYRSAHPCGEGDVLQRYVPLGCTNLNNPTQTLLGKTQRDWLVSGLTNSKATWKLLGNQTYMGRLSLTFLGAQIVPFNVDAWDGYAAERTLISQALREAKVKNFVVVTGDLHTYMASHTKADYGNLNPLDTSNYIGVEFMTPSITSANIGDQLGAKLTAEQRLLLLQGLSEGTVKLNNPHIQMFDSIRHGYSTVEFTGSYAEWVAYSVSKDVNDANTTRTCIARYRKAMALPWLLPMSTSGY